MMTFGQLALYSFADGQFPIYGLVGIETGTSETESIHARCTAHIKTVLEAMPNINGTSEMQSLLDTFSGEFFILQEEPTTYLDDFQGTNNVQFHYSILYFNVETDDRTHEPFTNTNRNIPADIIKNIVTDRTRGGILQNTVVRASGPGFFQDENGVYPVSFVSFDCRAMIDSVNQYEISA
jgi:hypothetical protein